MPGNLNRREMLRTAAAAGGAVALGALCPGAASAGSPLRLREALFYKALPGRKVQCNICPRNCTVESGKRGHCGSRENRGGKYFTLVYGSAAALNIDPVEKKPLFHFLPGARALSFGAAGCNFDCLDCQNWELSQSRPEELDSHHLPPDKAVEMAKQTGCAMIACTYSEPVTFYEYMHDTALLCDRAGLRTVMISNGYINRAPMTQACRYLDAVKVDWKGVTEKFYREYTGGTMQPVLNTMNTVKSQGTWLEIVYLVVPTANDSQSAIRSMAKWVKKYLGADTPVHFSRFHPDYKLKNLPPTPYATLDQCYETAREQGLNFVYLGNVPGHKAESTFCPKCGKLLIHRRGMGMLANHLKSGKCPDCGREIPGVWA